VVRAYVGFCMENAALLDLMYSIKHDPQASADLLEATGRWSELIGYADLAATRMLTPEAAEHGLDEVIAFILRGCAPDSRP